MQETRNDIIQFINLQLASLGQPTFKDKPENSIQFLDPKFEELTCSLIKSIQQRSRLLSNHLSPVDTRIQDFIYDYLKDVSINKSIVIPNNTLVLSKKGQAREISLPPDGDSFKSDLVTTSRIKQGILNNPLNDKRTTKGTFHIVEGSLPVTLDKKEVPKETFAHLLHSALILRVI
ncbi:hypothetical protein [Polaribacter atrinae]|uniref:hypothetical protein n=1 Tax=Polaribacter atrinae TaxID=1333662 RepID=UPI000AC6E477|nr:hypothetical protein [Polaribacter atrinae]